MASAPAMEYGGNIFTYRFGARAKAAIVTVCFFTALGGCGAYNFTRHDLINILNYSKRATASLPVIAGLG
jgi:7-keto-8-aminopelargonate synthetase-like enzyme|tara:strand:+ start:723 stop:932 length:210 start_codon:yes stop_codon:yes gene_type:complete